MQIVSVLIPLSLPRPYDYAVPDGMTLAPGDIVRVPLGSRQVNGVVWGDGPTRPNDNTNMAKIKPVDDKYDIPPLSPQLRRFVDWVAAYVMAPPGAVLRQVMRVPAAFEPPKPLTAYRAATRPDRMTAPRRRVFDALDTTGGLTRADLARAAQVSPAVIKTLYEGGYLQSYPVAGHQPFASPNPTFGGFDLSPAQAEVAEALRHSVATKSYAAHLLDGVTGSGKTEVYFEAIAAALEPGREEERRGKQRRAALVLLPEIALTAQFLDRFEARFGCAPALWHSGLGPSERRRTWREVAENRVPVLVGARSALFLPWHELGVIIVDEEHDGGYKQEDGVIYNARDMAVVRARLSACPVILSSATPSLESYVNAQSGRYTGHRLRTRHGGAGMPQIELVDMRHNPPPRGFWLVPDMVAGVDAALARHEQALLFLNRRGYAPLTICRGCGHRYACPDCDAWMVEHRFRQQLQCHHCGHLQPMPQNCDSCGEADKLTACGPGVERITEEILGHFPNARLVLLSSDHGGAQGLREQVKLIGEGGADIIVGTQIIAKGHHFPKLSFVGVVDADLGLGNGDLRAAERTYQLLNQVAGRSGRAAARPGFAMLQTHMPEHPVLQALAAGDRDGFFDREMQARRLAQMPPYGRLAALIISATEQNEALGFVRQMAAHIPTHADIRVLGPAPAPITRIRNRYRFRFLLKGAKNAPMQSFIAQWLAHVKPRGSVRLAVDIDPYRFL